MSAAAAKQLIPIALLALTISASAQEAAAPTLIRIRSTPRSKGAKSTPVPAPSIPAPTPQPNGGLPEPDDFMLKYNYLFGSHGKLRPTATRVTVADDEKTSAQRVAEMVRSFRKTSAALPNTPDTSWVHNATPAPPGYVAPTYKPAIRVATPPPKSSLPSIDVGGSSSPDY